MSDHLRSSTGEQNTRRADDHELIFRLLGSNPTSSKIQRLLLETCLGSVLRYGRAILSLQDGRVSDEALRKGARTTFEEALRRFPTLENEESLDAWILGIARGRFRRLRRKWTSRREQRTHIEPSGQYRAVPGSNAVRAGGGDVLDRMGELTRTQQEFVLLRHLMGLDIRQLARISGQSTSRVFRTLEQARGRLFPLERVQDRKLKFHERSHLRRMDRFKFELDLGSLTWVSAEEQVDCPLCKRELANWKAACLDLESVLNDRWPRQGPTPAELSVAALALERASGSLGRGERFRFPWAELTGIVGIALALMVILRASGLEDRSRSLPLFQPTAVPGPVPVSAVADVFLDLSQPEASESWARPAYHVAPRLSDDGHVLSFFYTGDFTQVGDRNGVPDFYRYDIDRDELEWLQSPDRVGSWQMRSTSSADGVEIIFTSNLSSIYGFASLDGCDGPCSSLVLKDDVSGDSQWLFPRSGEERPDSGSSFPYLTSDGHLLAFFSSSQELAEQTRADCPVNEISGQYQAYLLDRTSEDLRSLPFCINVDQTSFLSSIEVTQDGRYLLLRKTREQGDETEFGIIPAAEYLIYDLENDLFRPFLSDESGRRIGARILEAHLARNSDEVIFSTSTAGLLPADTNTYVDIYVLDLESGSLTLVSANNAGVAANGHSGTRFATGFSGQSREFALSPDGRFVAFVSLATDLVPGASTDCGEFFRRACGNIYLRDLVSGTTRVLVEEPLQEAYFSDLTISEGAERIAFLEQRYGCLPNGYCTRVWIHQLESGRTYDPLSGEEFTRDTSAAGNFAQGQSGVVYPSDVFTLFGGTLSSVALSPDGELIAAGMGNGHTYLVDAATGELKHDLAYQELPVFQVQFTGDGRELFAAARDGSLVQVDVQSGELSFRTFEVPDRFQSMAVAPSGEWIALAGQNELWLKAVAQDELKLVYFQRIDQGPLRALAFSPDSQLLAVGSGDGSVWLLSTTSRDVIMRLSGHAGRVLGLLFSPGSDLLATTGADNMLNLWRLTIPGGGEPEADLLLSAVHHEWVADMAFTPDGSQLASVAFDHRVWLYATDPVTDKTPPITIAGGVLFHIFFGADGADMYVASAVGVMRIEGRHWATGAR